MHLSILCFLFFQVVLTTKPGKICIFGQCLVCLLAQNSNVMIASGWVVRKCLAAWYDLGDGKFKDIVFEFTTSRKNTRTHKAFCSRPDNEKVWPAHNILFNEEILKCLHIRGL